MYLDVKTRLSNKFWACHLVDSVAMWLKCNRTPPFRVVVDNPEVIQKRAWSTSMPMSSKPTSGPAQLPYCRHSDAIPSRMIFDRKQGDFTLSAASGRSPLRSLRRRYQRGSAQDGNNKNYRSCP